METPSDSLEFGPFIFLENGHGRLLHFPGTGKLSGYLVIDRRSGELAQLQLIESNEDPIKAILHVSTWRQAQGDFPVIPKMLDCGIDDLIPYYAAEIPRGEPLHHYLNRARPWPVEAAVRCVSRLVRELIDRPPFCVYRHALSLQSIWLEQAPGDLPRLILGDLSLEARPDAPFRNAELFARILAKLTRGAVRDREFAALCQKIESCSGTLEYIEQCLGEYLERFDHLTGAEIALPDQPENYRIKMQPARPLIDVNFKPRVHAIDPTSLLCSYRLAPQNSAGVAKLLTACRLLLVAGTAASLFYLGFPQQAFRISHTAPIAGPGTAAPASRPMSAFFSFAAPVLNFDLPAELRTDSMNVDQRISLLHRTIRDGHRRLASPGDQDSKRANAELARNKKDYFSAIRLETELLKAEPQNSAARQRLDGDLFYLSYVLQNGLTEGEKEILQAAAAYNPRAVEILNRR